MAALSILTEETLATLRSELAGRIGEYRFRHTLGVEEAIASLGALYLPEEVMRLRVAALLHDLTKEWSAEEQIAFCREHDIEISEAEVAAPKVLHAKTGAFLAEVEFFPLVDAEIVRAIREHTVAAPDMSVFSALLYLADYIEPTRTYADCVALRAAFYDGYSEENKYTHLAGIMVRALQASVDEVRSRGGEPIADTVDALIFFSENDEMYKGRKNDGKS